MNSVAALVARRFHYLLANLTVLAHWLRHKVDGLKIGAEFNNHSLLKVHLKLRLEIFPREPTY